MEKRSLAIGSGRELAYREVGKSDGPAVVYCHGGFMSGLDIAPWADAASAAGVRIVAPARPGLDGSSSAAGRTTGDWADDVRALLDGLEIQRASVFGWSMGGQYALACAARLADRVMKAVVIAGAIPLTDDQALQDLNKMDRRLTKQAQDRPWAARLTLGAMAQMAKHAPKMWTKTLTKDLPDAEAKTVRGFSDSGLADAAAAGLSSTHGMVEEYLAWARPWGFDAADVTVPTMIVQGTADTLVPDHWGEVLAQQIPNATLSMHEGEGHFVGYSHQAEVLAALT
jgi:pimeloyl-ACP methyl ester carboxylesterase